MQIIYFKNNGTVLLDSVTKGEIVVGAERTMQVTNACFYVTFSQDATGGSVEISTGPFVGYDGDWAVRDTVYWKQGNRTHYVWLRGPHLALKIRIKDPLAHGTVSVVGAGLMR